MNNAKTTAYELSAQTIIKNLKKRNMDGIYFKNSDECVKYIISEIPEGSSVTWGGSETIKEMGLSKAIQSGNYNFIDRNEASTKQESRELYAKQVLSDYFFMSSNAITLDGELVNIDGNGNRVACMIQGPEHVYVFVGMNKVVKNVEDGFNRIRTFACPPNTVRLNMNTPCSKTGVCAECHGEDCICCQMVVTRHSRHKGRIKVFLIGEELGY